VFFCLFYWQNDHLRTKNSNFVEDHPRNIPAKFGSNRPSGFGEAWNVKSLQTTDAYSTWLPGPIICSDWLKFQRSSSLKLINWLNPNCTWIGPMLSCASSWWQSSRWAPVFRPKTSKTSFGPVYFSDFYKNIYI
jgi:hypothetical protein